LAAKQSIAHDDEMASRVDLREISGHTTVVTLVGDHDVFTKERLVEELERARLAATVIVDLTPCSFVDSTIIEALLSARHRMRVELVMPSRDSIVDRALRITGCPELFTTHASLESALDAQSIR
jgi:anti-anti-sigma factor